MRYWQKKEGRFPSGKEKTMSQHRYLVTLTPDQRDRLTHLTRAGSSPAYQQVVARVLLKLDRSDGGPLPSDEQIAEALEISRRTVIRIKERFVSEGLDATLGRKYPQTRPERRRITGQEEAHLIALACGPAPEGQQRWTLRLLADKMVELHHVDQISHETVRQALKKMNSSHG
jgi:transposase